MSTKPKKLNMREFEVSPDTFQSGLYTLGRKYLFKGYTWDQIVARAGSGRNLSSGPHGDEIDQGQFPDMAQGSYLKEDFNEKAPISKNKSEAYGQRTKRFLKTHGPSGDKSIVKTACVLEVMQAYLEQVFPGKNIRLAAPTGGNPHRGVKYDKNGVESEKVNKSQHTAGRAMDIQLSIDGNPIGENTGIVYATLVKLIQTGKLPTGGLGYYATGNESSPEFGLADAAKYNKSLKFDGKPASSCGPIGGRTSGHIHYDWRDDPMTFWFWSYIVKEDGEIPGNVTKINAGGYKKPGLTLEEFIENKFIFDLKYNVRYSDQDAQWSLTRPSDHLALGPNNVGNKAYIPRGFWERFKKLPDPEPHIPTLEEVYQYALDSAKKFKNNPTAYNQYNFSLKGKTWPPQDKDSLPSGYKNDLVYLIAVNGNPNFPNNPNYGSGHEGKYWPSLHTSPSPYSPASLGELWPGTKLTYQNVRDHAALYGFEQLLTKYNKSLKDWDTEKFLIYPAAADAEGGAPQQIEELPSDLKSWRSVINSSSPETPASVGIINTASQIRNKDNKMWYLVAVDASFFDSLSIRGIPSESVRSVIIPYHKLKRRREFWKPFGKKLKSFTKKLGKGPFGSKSYIASKNFDHEKLYSETQGFLKKLNSFLDNNMTHDPKAGRSLVRKKEVSSETEGSVKSKKKINFRNAYFRLDLAADAWGDIKPTGVYLEDETGEVLAYAGTPDGYLLASLPEHTTVLQEKLWLESGIPDYFDSVSKRIYQNSVMNFIINAENIKKENSRQGTITFYKKYLRGLRLTHKSPVDAVINFNVSGEVYQDAESSLSEQISNTTVVNHRTGEEMELNGPKVLKSHNSKLYASVKETEKEKEDINEIKKAIQKSEEQNLLQKVDKFFEKQKTKASDAWHSQTAQDIERGIKLPFSALPPEAGIISTQGYETNFRDDVYKATPDLDLSPTAEKFMPGTPGERGPHTLIPKASRALQSSNSPFADFIANSGVSTYVSDSLIFRIKNGSLLKNIRTVDDLYEHIYKKLTVKDLILMSFICAENIDAPNIPDQSWLEQLDELLKTIASTRVNIINVQGMPVRDLLSGYASATWDFSMKALETVAVEYIKTILVEIANCNIKGAIRAGKDGAVNAYDYVKNPEGAFKTISDFFLDQVDRGAIGRLIGIISDAMTPEEIMASFTGIPIRDGVYGELRDILSVELNIPPNKIGDIPWLLKSLGVHFDLAQIQEDTNAIDETIERTLCDEDYLKKFFEDRGLPAPEPFDPFKLMPPGDLNTDPCESGIKDPVGDMYAGKILSSIFKSLKSFFDLESSVYPSSLVQSSNIKKSPIKLNEEGEPDGEYGPGDLPPYELLEHKAGFGNVTYEVLPKLRDHLRSEQSVELLEGLSSPALELLLEEREEYLLDMQDIVSEILDYVPNKGGWCPNWDGETSGDDPTGALEAEGDLIDDDGTGTKGFHGGHIEALGFIPGTSFENSIAGAGYGNHSASHAGNDNNNNSKNWHTYMLEYLAKLDLYDPMLASNIGDGLEARWFVLQEDYGLKAADSHRYDLREKINESRPVKEWEVGDPIGGFQWWVHGRFSNLYRMKQGKVTLLSVLETMRWLIAIGEQPQYQDLWDPPGADFTTYGAGPIPGASQAKSNMSAFGANVGMFAGYQAGFYGALFLPAAPVFAGAALGIGAGMLVGGLVGAAVVGASGDKPHPHSNETLVNDKNNSYGSCSEKSLKLGIRHADVHHPIQNGVIGACYWDGLSSRCGKLWPFGAARRISYAQQVESAIESGLFQEGKHSVWAFQYETLYDDLQSFKSWYEDLKEIYDNLVLFDQKRMEIEEELKASGKGTPSLKVKLNKIRQMSNLTKRQENKILQGNFNIAALAQTTATEGESATPDITNLTQTKKSQSLFYNINKGYTRIAHPGMPPISFPDSKTGESVSTFNDVLVEADFMYRDPKLPADVDAVVGSLNIDVTKAPEKFWAGGEASWEQDEGGSYSYSAVAKSAKIDNPNYANRTFGSEVFSSLCWNSWDKAFGFSTSQNPINLPNQFFNGAQLLGSSESKSFVEATFKEFFRDEYRYVLEDIFQTMMSRISYSSLFGETGVSQVNTLDFIINPFCKVSEEKDLLNLSQIVQNAVERKQGLECNGVLNAYGLAVNEAVATVVVRLYIIEFLLSTIFYYPIFGQMALATEAVIFTISETIKVDIKNKRPGIYQRFMAECERIATLRGELDGVYENIAERNMEYGIDNSSIGLRALVAGELEYMSNIFTADFLSMEPIVASNVANPLDLLLETPTSSPEQYETPESAKMAQLLPRVVWPYVHDVPAVVYDTPAQLGHGTTYDKKLPNLDYGRAASLTNKYHEMFDSAWYSTEANLQNYGSGLAEADFSPYEIPWTWRPYPQPQDNVVFSVGERMENELAQKHPDAKSPREFFRKGGFILEKYIIAERHGETPQYVQPYIHWFCPVMPEQKAGYDYHQVTTTEGAMPWFQYMDHSYLAGFDTARQGSFGTYGYGPDATPEEGDIPNNNNNLDGYCPVAEFKKLTAVGALNHVETIDAKILNKNKEISEVLKEIINYKITYYDGNYWTTDEGVAADSNPHGHLNFKNWVKTTLPSSNRSVASYEPGDKRPQLYLMISGYRRKKGSNYNSYHHDNLLVDITELGLHARACLEKKPFYGAPDRWHRTPDKGSANFTQPLSDADFTSPFSQGPGFHTFWSIDNASLQFCHPFFAVQRPYYVEAPDYSSEDVVNQSTALALEKLASEERSLLSMEADYPPKHSLAAMRSITGWGGAGDGKKPFQGPTLFSAQSLGTQEHKYISFPGIQHDKNKYYNLDYPGCEPEKYKTDNPFEQPEPFEGPSSAPKTNRGPWRRPLAGGQGGIDTTYTGAGSDNHPKNDYYLPDINVGDSEEELYVAGKEGLVSPDGIGYGLPYANINTFIANLEWHKFRVANYEHYHRCVHDLGDNSWDGDTAADGVQDADFGTKLCKPNLEKMITGHTWQVGKDWSWDDIDIKYSYTSDQEAQRNYYSWLVGLGQGTPSEPDKHIYNGINLVDAIVDSAESNIEESAKLFDGMIKLGSGTKSHVGIEKINGSDTKAYKVIDAWHTKLVKLREELYNLTKIKQEGSTSGYVAAPGTNWPKQPHTDWFKPYRYGLRLSYVVPAERNWTSVADLESPTLSKTLAAEDRDYEHPNNIVDIYNPNHKNFKGISSQELEHYSETGNQLGYADSPMQTIINHELIYREKKPSAWLNEAGTAPVYYRDSTPISKYRSFISDEQDGKLVYGGITSEEIESIVTEAPDESVGESQGYEGLSWLNDMNANTPAGGFNHIAPPQWRRVYKVPLVEVDINMAEHHGFTDQELPFNVTLQGINVEEQFPLGVLKQKMLNDAKFKLLFEHVFPIEKILSLTLTSLYNSVLSGVSIDSRLYAIFDTSKETALSMFEGAVESSLETLDFQDPKNNPPSSYADLVSSTRPEPGAPGIAKAFSNITPFMILKGVVEASDSTIATAKGLRDTILTKLEQVENPTDNQRKVKKTLEHPASMVPFSLALLPFPLFSPPPLGLNLTPLGIIYLALTPFGLDMKDQMRAKGFNNIEDLCE